MMHRQEKCHHQSKRNGFTLLEMLFVLGVWSLLLTLTVPLAWPMLAAQQEKQFMDTLQSDIMYIQSLPGSKMDQIKIILRKTEYSVQTSLTQPEITRPLPPGWKYDVRVNNTISFFEDGRMRDPRTIKFIVNGKKEVKLVFPLGKGRGYFVKE